MEPDVMPLHSTSPPPLTDDEEEVGAEEDEFGDFGGFSLGVSCFVDSPNSPSSLGQPRPSTTSLATHLPNASFNRPVEQSQPASMVVSAIARGEMGARVQHCDAESPPSLANGYPERDCSSDDSTGGSDTASFPDGCSPGEGDPGFADFTAFAEQTGNPWCCGFSPAGGMEPWDSRARGTNLTEDVAGELPRGTGQEVAKGPGSLCAPTEEGSEEEYCTKAKHCEQRDITPILSSQDHQPQDPTAVLTSPTEEEELGEPGDSNRERSPQEEEKEEAAAAEAEEETESGDERTEEEESVSTLPPTASLCESVSEDFASFCDVVSPEGLPEDFHPCFSSPTVLQVNEALAQETDGEEDEDENEDDDARNIRCSDTCSSHRSSKPSQSEAVKGLSHLDQSESMGQETPVKPNQSETEADEEAVLTDKEGSSGGCSDQECVEIASAGKPIQANLPPSDSFADFCSAPTEGDGEACWAEFRDPRAQTEGKTWVPFEEDGSAKLSERTTDVEQDGLGGGDSSRRNSLQGSLSSRVQKLLQASFPEALGLVGEEGEGEEDVPSLSILLQTHDSQSEDEEQSRVQWGVCQHQDVHSALALKFQWGGSHSNRTLLRCLGVDTRNIVFAGEKKQPLIVPAFASNLGMLEPTKEPVPATESLHTEVTGQEPLESHTQAGISTKSTQVLSSSQLNLSSHGLSSSQDGMSPRRVPHFWGWK